MSSAKTANIIASAGLAVAIMVGAFNLIAVVPVIQGLRDKPAASVSEPLQGSKLNSQNVQVSDMATNIPKDQDLWLIIRGESYRAWYPVQRIVVQSDGSWTVNAADVLLPSTGVYNLHAVVVPGAATVEFDAYIKNSRETDKHPGIEVLPSGSTLLDSIQVLRV